MWGGGLQMADDGETAPAPSPQPGGPRRMTMIVLLTAFSSINYSTRGALPLCRRS